MKVTLNKANKIRTILENFLREVSSNIDPNEMIYLTGYESSFVSVDNMRIEKLQKIERSLHKFEKVNSAIYELRNTIQKVNLENGINDLISQIAETNSLIQELSKFVEKNDDSTVDLSTMLKANRESTEKDSTNSIYGKKAIPFSHVSVLPSAWINDVIILAKNAKKKILQLEEERNAKNHTILIELPTSVSEILTENDLI